MMNFTTTYKKPMIMNKILFITFFFLMTTQVSYGQKNKRDKIKTLKIAYLTEKLELTPNEAENFWPIYNTYFKKNRQIRRSRNKILFQNTKTELNENLANENLQQLIAIEKRQYENKIQLITDLKNVLSSKKIIGLFVAEKDFNKKLLKLLRRS